MKMQNNFQKYHKNRNSYYLELRKREKYINSLIHTCKNYDHILHKSVQHIIYTLCYNLIKYIIFTAELNNNFKSTLNTLHIILNRKYNFQFDYNSVLNSSLKSILNHTINIKFIF